MKYVAVTLVLLLSLCTQAQSNPANAATVARGKYLVECVGVCSDCHSPRDQKGEFVRAQWLQGAPIMFKPTVPMPAWADKAPRIAGLPGWKDADAVKFLMTGMAYNGLPANPPMPPYRFSRADATAIVAYLKSLRTSSVAQRPAAGKLASVGKNNKPQVGAQARLALLRRLCLNRGREAQDRLDWQDERARNRGAHRRLSETALALCLYRKSGTG